MKIAIRTDASLLIGSGHVMRCKTLADELRKRNSEIMFICRDHPGNLVSLLTDDGYSVTTLPPPCSLNVVQADKSDDYSAWLGVEQSIDAEQTIEALGNFHPDWLVVDHYGLDEPWEKMLRGHVHKIFVIDDFADRPHDCDVLLNQNLVSDLGNTYESLVPDHCRKLLGPRFALLRPEFRKARETLRDRDGIIRRLLVFFGGVDPTGETEKALEALEMLGRPDIAVDAVVGSNNPRREKIEGICRGMRNVTFHQQISNMAELMAAADLAIGAGGTASWERCCLGLPALLASIADNQLGIIQTLSDAKAAKAFRKASHLTSEIILKELRNLIDRPDLVKSMTTDGLKLVDCNTTRRVMGAFGGSLQLSIISSPDSWINEFIPKLLPIWKERGHRVTWVHDHEHLVDGDCAFFLSYERRVPQSVLQLHVHNLVVHESNLPKGRGWSPLTWQILEAKNSVPIVLFECAEKIDSGLIYLADQLRFDGHELITEMRAVQAEKTLTLCEEFVANYPHIVRQGRHQEGVPSYYRRRTFEDSELPINKSLSEQFNLLRVVDNDKYPAYFTIHGHRYILSIRKSDVVGGNL